MGGGVGRWGKEGELWERAHAQSMTSQTQLLQETTLKTGQDGISRSNFTQLCRTL